MKTLRAKERIPQQRPANTRFDGMFEIPTFEEVLALVHSVNEQRRRSAHGKDERHVRLSASIRDQAPDVFPGYRVAAGGASRADAEPLWLRQRARSREIQSFEVANLRKLAKMTKVQLVQLVSDVGAPWDFVVAKDPRTYADLAKPAGLKEIAEDAWASARTRT